MQHSVSMLGAALATLSTLSISGSASGQAPTFPPVTPAERATPAALQEPEARPEPQPGPRTAEDPAPAPEAADPTTPAPRTAGSEPPVERSRRTFRKALRRAGRGSLSATEWCLEHFDRARPEAPRQPVPPSASATSSFGTLAPEPGRHGIPRAPYTTWEASTKKRLYGRWIDLWNGDLRGTGFDILGSLAHEASGAVPSLGRGVSLELLDRLLLTAGAPRTSAEVWLAKARMLAQGGTPEEVARARHLYTEIQSRFAGTRFAERAAKLAARALWREEHLAVGQLAPDFVTRDFAGNEIRLSEFRGQVVVVHFWRRDSSREAEDRSLDSLRDLAQRHWDTPFALIGVDGDAGRDQHRERWVEHGVNWHEAFEPAPGDGARCAWQIDEWPSTYLIDSEGVVRGVARPGVKLGKLVDPLIYRHAHALENVAGTESNQAQ